MVCTAGSSGVRRPPWEVLPSEDPSCSGPVLTAKTTLNPAHVRPEKRALHNEPRLDDHQGHPCYVSNGIFIAAALARGFRIERLPSDPNVYLNIPETLAREASG